MTDDFLCLGIETSCDETSAAIVRNGQEVLSNIVLSQAELHRAYGGVVPELACRAHTETLLPAIEEAFQKAAVQPKDLTAIAVTYRPGLIGALLVGLSTAKTLSFLLKRPLVGVDHLHGHIYANELSHPDLPYPNVHLLVSGGHTNLYLCEDPLLYRELGATRDDAAGEAFDKVASMLGLAYPGGPEIEKLSRQGDSSKIRFPRGTTGEGSLDFSFSGLKTAVLYHLRGQNARRSDGQSPRGRAPGKRKKAQEARRSLSQNPADIAASFQQAIVAVLVEKTMEAAQRYAIDAVTIGGGVASNGVLRDQIREACDRAGLKLYLPEKKYCTDNAAMIAGVAYHFWRAGLVDELTLDAVPTRR